MRKVLNILLFSAILMCFGIMAQAQYGREGSPYQPDAVNTLVERVHTDLNHGYDKWHLSKGDRERMNNAEKRLREFAKDWRNAKFDKGALDDAIAAIQHVLDNNHLSGPDRDALWNDVEALRQMREEYNRHEIGRW